MKKRMYFFTMCIYHAENCKFEFASAIVICEMNLRIGDKLDGKTNS